MSPWLDGDPAHLDSFPRVSGDEPSVHVERARSVEFSPRERG